MDSKETWVKHCDLLVKNLWSFKNNFLFRGCPAFENDYSSSKKTIKTPMNLKRVKERLELNEYKNPTEFSKDMNLVFENSKTFTREGKMYERTLTLEKKYKKVINRVIGYYKNMVAKKSSAKK